MLEIRTTNNKILPIIGEFRWRGPDKSRKVRESDGVVFVPIAIGIFVEHPDHLGVLFPFNRKSDNHKKTLEIIFIRLLFFAS